MYCRHCRKCWAYWGWSLSFSAQASTEPPPIPRDDSSFASLSPELEKEALLAALNAIHVESIDKLKEMHKRWGVHLCRVWQWLLDLIGNSSCPCLYSEICGKRIANLLTVRTKLFVSQRIIEVSLLLLCRRSHCQVHLKCFCYWAFDCALTKRFFLWREKSEMEQSQTKQWMEKAKVIRKDKTIPITEKKRRLKEKNNQEVKKFMEERQRVSMAWKCFTFGLIAQLSTFNVLWQGWPTSRSRPDRSVDRAWFCIELSRYLKRTLFNQCSRKYIKIIHQLVGHVYFFGASCDGWP